MTALRIGTGTVVLSVMLTAASAGSAREPGVGASFVPDITLGQANAVPLSPGARLGSRSTYLDANLLGNDSKPTGLRYQTAAEIVLLTWVPEGRVLGAGYKAFAVVPFASSTLIRDAPVAPAARGTFTQVAMGNPKLQFIDLSWSLGEGFYVSSGFGVYFPSGKWSATSPVNVGSPFWTFEPNAAVSYFKDGWTASLQGVYDTNTTNPTNNYYSGDQVVLNATLMKMFGGVNVGPVGYWLKQVSSDANYGGRTVYGGAASLPGEQLAIGATASTQFGNLSVQLMFTQDVYAQNGLYGSKGWLALSYHFK